MTLEEISKFVSKGRIVCPYCPCEEPDGQSLDTQDDRIVQEMFCPECNRSWEFLYELVWVIEEEE